MTNIPRGFNRRRSRPAFAVGDLVFIKPKIVSLSPELYSFKGRILSGHWDFSFESFIYEVLNLTTHKITTISERLLTK